MVGLEGIMVERCGPEHPTNRYIYVVGPHTPQAVNEAYRQNESKAISKRVDKLFDGVNTEKTRKRKGEDERW